MRVIFAQEPIPEERGGIFLAGPTRRTYTHPCVDDWRYYMRSALQTVGCPDSMLLYIPEPESGNWDDCHYLSQVEWEFAAMYLASVILFWIPRNMQLGMLGLTTNVEFGFWLRSGKVILGYPENAEHVYYLAWLLEKETGRIPFKTMEDAAIAAIKMASI